MLIVLTVTNVTCSHLFNMISKTCFFNLLAINHNILLEKLKAVGLCVDTVNWFHSYLTDWAFLVSIENKYSSFSKILCSVPQGSILCTLLFLIYVNDRKQAVSSDLLLYAVST